MYSRQAAAPNPIQAVDRTFPAECVVLATAADSALFIDTETERYSFTECVLALGDPPGFIGAISDRMAGVATHVFLSPLFDHPRLELQRAAVDTPYCGTVPFRFSSSESL